MPERKPPHLSWESFADRQIREAQERGAFDNLKGTGKPLRGLDRPYQADWWLQELAAREGLSVESPALLLRQEVGQELEALAEVAAEDKVRLRIEALNTRIARTNATNWRGAPTTLPPMNVQAVVPPWPEKPAGAAAAPKE